jgi:hydroxyethylthiazole kinase-like uncharacterized protein yjeF
LLPPENVFATAAQIKQLDQLAENQYGRSAYFLMQKAGERIAASLTENYPSTSIRFVIFCGKGNNGGDGIVIGRELEGKGYAVQIWILADNTDEMSETARQHFRDSEFDLSVCRFLREEDGLEMIMSLSEADVVIDALLGISLKGNPRGHYQKCIEAINQAEKQVIAVDLPSGLDADQGLVYESVIKAQKTYTVAVKKKCMTDEKALGFCGDIHVVDIGFPEPLLKEVLHL